MTTMTKQLKQDTGLIIFARAPVAGKAKTRLIPALGAEGAATCQAALTRRALTTACQLCPHNTLLACAPNSQQPFFIACQRQFSVALQDQQGCDLGERMHHALVQGLQSLSRVILIGTDSPVIDADYLLAAEAALENSNDAVIGPADDGGYVLIGLSRPAGKLFRQIDWGSAQVYRQTRQRLAQTGLRWQALDHRWDIDHPADLTRLATTRADIYQQLQLPPLRQSN